MEEEEVVVEKEEGGEVWTIEVISWKRCLNLLMLNYNQGDEDERFESEDPGTALHCTDPDLQLGQHPVNSQQYKLRFSAKKVVYYEVVSPY